MQIKYVQGNLFNFIQKDTIITHVVNNGNVMGAGFVIPLCKTYPIIKKEYHKWYDKQEYLQNMATPFGLGCTQIVQVEPAVFVANMMAQTLYDRPRPLRYNKLCDCMERIIGFVKKKGLSILAPKFGSELAGGNWQFIEELITDIWIENGIDVTVVNYRGNLMKEYIDLIVMAIVILLIMIGVWVGASYFEARAYNKITHSNVSTFDAMFVELRVQGTPND